MAAEATAELTLRQGVDVFRHRWPGVQSRSDASDPSDVDESDGTYSPDDGHLRIWTKDGDVARDKAAANADSNPGDYIESYDPDQQIGSTIGTEQVPATRMRCTIATQQTGRLKFQQ